MKSYDLVVVGLGIMGAATVWKASGMGASVLALDAGGPTHQRGSSHGATRIYRRAYWEGEDYLDLLNLADLGWRDLEARSQTALRVQTGGLFVGPRRSGLVAGSLATAVKGAIAHEHLAAEDIGRRFPQFAAAPAMEAIFEPGAYVVLAEEARLRMLDAAVVNGARLVYGARVVDATQTTGGPTVKMASGETIAAGAIVVCAGAWSPALIEELGRVVAPRSVPIHWFTPRIGAEAAFDAKAFPLFLREEEDGALLYGVPAGASCERGVKIGFHNKGQIPFDPTSEPPDIAPFADEISHVVERIFPDLDPHPRQSKWCVYTMSEDESFIIDRSMRQPRALFVSACSGHGFKFAPAIGAVAAELALGATASADVARFALSRFAGPRSTARR